MASAAAELERVFYRTDPGETDVLVKWQKIQDNIFALGPNALRDLMAEFLRTFIAANNTATPEVLAVVDSWFRRALFAESDRQRPVSLDDPGEWIPAEKLQR